MWMTTFMTSGHSGGKVCTHNASWCRMHWNCHFYGSVFDILHRERHLYDFLNNFTFLRPQIGVLKSYWMIPLYILHPWTASHPWLFPEWPQNLHMFCSHSSEATITGVTDQIWPAGLLRLFHIRVSREDTWTLKHPHNLHLTSVLSTATLSGWEMRTFLYIREPEPDFLDQGAGPADWPQQTSVSLSKLQKYVEIQCHQFLSQSNIMHVFSVLPKLDFGLKWHN